MRVPHRMLRYAVALALITAILVASHVVEWQSVKCWIDHPDLQHYQIDVYQPRWKQVSDSRARLEHARKRVEQIAVNMYYFVGHQLLRSGKLDDSRAPHVCYGLQDRLLVVGDILNQASAALSDIQRSSSLHSVEFSSEKQPTFIKEIGTWVTETQQVVSSWPSCLVSAKRAGAQSAELVLATFLTQYRKILQLLRSWTSYTDRVLNRSARIQALANTLEQRWLRQQYPGRCDLAKKLVCTNGQDGGLGANVRWLMYCFWLAYASGRVLQFDTHGWYYTSEPWDSVFQPLTNCTSITLRAVRFGKRTEQHDVVKMEYFHHIYLPQYRLRSMPLDLAPELELVDLDPFEWVGGQMAQFILRLQPQVRLRVEKELEEMKIRHPIVGFHVRRTDKIQEAAYQPLDQYFDAAEIYFRQFEANSGSETPIQRRVLIATDEPSVIKEARRRYPNYEVIANQRRASSAGKSRKVANESLLGTVIDLFALARTDHLVCTPSSNVCRLVHQMRQVDSNKRRSDSTHFLDDDGWELYFQRKRLFRAIYAQRRDSNYDMIVVEIGDLIEYIRSEPNGMIHGINLRTCKIGRIPLYKVEELVHQIAMDSNLVSAA